MERISMIYEIPTDIFNPVEIYDEGGFVEEYIDDITNNFYVEKYISEICTDIKRGDILHFQAWSTYRNDGKLMWNGYELIPLADDIDEYGHLPYEIKIEEFDNINYFSRSIVNNNIINIMGEDYEIIQANTKVIDTESDGKYYLYTVFNSKINTEWKILSAKTGNEFAQSLIKGAFDTKIAEDFADNFTSYALPSNVLFDLDD